MIRTLCVVLLGMIVTAQTVFAGEQLIVRLREQASSNALALQAAAFSLGGIPLMVDGRADKSLEQPLSIEQTEALRALRRYVVVDIGVEERDVAMRRLLRNANVEQVFVNNMYHIHADGFTNDSLSSRQFALGIVDAKTAWPLATGRGVLVGVLDTGVDWLHEDLRRVLAVNSDEDRNANGMFEARPTDQLVDGVGGDLDGIDNDGNGYVDDVIGYDFVDQQSRNIGDDRDRDPFPVDEQGHGTSVAGVIAATPNNKVGIAGLAFDARVLALRAFDATGNAEEDDIAAAIIYAVLRGARVINMSFGDGVDAPVLRDAVRFAASFGCTLIASAGNSGVVTRQFPAGYDDVIAVGSTNAEDVRSPFSSTGSLLAITAPGEAIITTQAGGGYRSVSGTSFAAPYAAAVAAMLIEKAPQISPNEVRGTLEEQSIDLGPKGWDAEYGSGRIDAGRPLLAPSFALVRITNIRNEQEIDVRTGQSIEIRGSAIATLFASYALYVGVGIEPQAWTLLAEGQQQRDALLGTMPTTSLGTGLHTLRLVVTLQNGRTIEDRKRFDAIGADTLRFTSFEMISAWQADVRVPVMTFRTSRQTSCLVRYRPTGTSQFEEFSDVWSEALTHSFVLNNVQAGREYEYLVTCTADDGTVVERTELFTVKDEAARIQGWSTVDDQPFAGYVLNDVRDLYGDGKPTFVMNDLGSGTFGEMKTVQRSTASFVPRDTTVDTWIPRGMGDSNGDGIVEVFGHVVGQARLFQARARNENPFETTLFADTLSRRWNAAGMLDVDGDGKPELLMLSDSGCLAVTYRNGQYIRLGVASNPTPPAIGSLANRVDEISIASGDFDGDGTIELAFSDTDGDLVVSEFMNGSFRTEFTHESEGNGGSGYVAALDANGDGRLELVYGVPDSTQPNSERDYGRHAWTYRMFRATAADTYESVWTDHISGVRTGIGFRNGIGAAQLDARGGDELIVCTFAHMYVFSWESTLSEGAAILYRPDVVSPRFLTYDFNKDGFVELGYGTTRPSEGYMSAFQFVQMDTSVAQQLAPRGLRARLTSDTTVLLTWASIPGADRYVVYRATNTDGVFRRVDSTTTTTLPLQQITPGATHRYRITAVLGTTESPRSAIATVQSFAACTAIALLPSSIDTSDAARGASLRIRYSESISERLIEPSAFQLVQGSLLLASATSAVLAGDSTVVIRFAPTQLAPGAYEVACAPIRDVSDVPTKASKLALSVTAASVTDEVVLSHLRVLDAHTVRLYFDRPVTTPTASVLANYAITPSGAIASLEHDADSVTIHFDPNSALGALGITYYITVSDVMGVDGAAMTQGAGNTLGFVFTASNLSDVFVYPHPAQLGRDASITFANLTTEADVEILDQRFQRVALVTERDGNGGASWDMYDERGTRVPPGVYFYRVLSPSTANPSVESGMMKLLIRR